MLPSTSPLVIENFGWGSFQDLAMAFAEDLFGGPVTTYAETWQGGRRTWPARFGVRDP